MRRLSVIFPYRIEDIESPEGPIERNHAMLDAARDAPHIAGAQPPRLVADGEHRLSFEHDADLLMRMGMLGHLGVRLHLYLREHHLFDAAGGDLDSRKNGAARKIFGGR